MAATRNTLTTKDIRFAEKIETREGLFYFANWRTQNCIF
jgi:hypothetical protein